jgi:hypothetical protein
LEAADYHQRQHEPETVAPTSVSRGTGGASANGGEIASRDTPVFLRLQFFLQRPVSLPKRFTEPTKKPDWDKLVRALCDSLTGVLFDDDSQVVQAFVAKKYGQPERVEISLTTLESEFHEDPAVRESLALFPVGI